MTILQRILQPEPSFSFEYFPPKTEPGEVALFRTVERMKEHGPSFVSITCGAGGSTRRNTVGWAERLTQDLGLETMVHLPCVGLSEEEIAQTIEEIRGRGLRNILALRGDIPKEGELKPSRFAYANELVQFIRERYPEACIGAACYPEGHPESGTLGADLDNLKRKADAGVDFFITQLFFDNRSYFEFVGRARSKGITQPILPGIMPIHDVAQTKKFSGTIKAAIPPHLLQLLDQYDGSPQAVYYIGVAHAIAQCDELLQAGAPGIHFITLNRSPATRLVLEALQAPPKSK